ncbi:MAG: Bro-N domain-containing protein [Candidatus Peregrinibacteria bacterium]|nr:Bro-N domain-containing protein [Candidatus Peregrinibacteria bacterium]
MKKEESIILFNQKEVRRYWDAEKELWFFSVVDVISVLTDSTTPKRYWSDLKSKLKMEGSQVYDKIVQLKFTATDGKKYATDCYSTQDLLRLVQSIPSPKAEPFKVWLAQVGYQRIEEMENPELSFERAATTYARKGYSKSWINQRLKSIEIRKELTDEWSERGMSGGSIYALLTDDITKAWSGKSVKEYKELKGLKKEGLRDNMTTLELVLNMLAEASTTEISKEKKPVGLDENRDVAKEGGSVAGVARKEIEKKTGKSVVSRNSSRQLLN